MICSIQGQHGLIDYLVKCCGNGMLLLFSKQNTVHQSVG